ncbi:trichohyalin [Drosophila serrata]|uniref:trichohyalin n=1 Tax=Drosophila serrata TaxID=7274 RepID=UPI000A1D2436|nr:trichohyalin [Drosophila serrata]
MPMVLGCRARNALKLHPDCYDRLKRPIYMEPPPSTNTVKDEPCGSRRDKPVKPKEQKRTLPPGTIPPRPLPGPQPGQRTGGSKAPPRARNYDGAKATFFHIKGQPWESKGYAELSKNDLDRMRGWRPPTVEERRAEQERQLEEQSFQTAEAERMRTYFHDIDEQRREKEREAQKKVDAEADEDIDEDRKVEAKRLQVLHRALDAKYESDVRVKEATRAISEAKCSAMWTAQIQERKLLDRIQSDHDEEMARKNLLYNNSKWGTVEQNDQKEEERRKQFGMAVREQIKDREQLRFMAEDRVRADARELRAAIDEVKKAEAAEVDSRSKRKVAYREELNTYMQLHKDFVRMMCEQDQRDEIRAYEYRKLKEKQLREQRAEREAIEADAQQKRNVLFAVGQKALDAKGNREEMHYLAEVERMERKYRENERKAAEKERRLAADIKKANLEHMEHLSQMKACYYVQREREIKEMIEYQAKLEEQMKREADEQELKKHCLRTGVSCQIEEREKARRRELEDERLAIEREKAAEAQRQKEIDTVITVKLDDLQKRGCLPSMAVRSLKGRVANAGLKKKFGSEYS